MHGFRTNKLFLSAALAGTVATSESLAQLVAPGAGKQWATTFSTEFNTGQSDLTGWTYDIGNGQGGWGNNELQFYTNSSTNSFISTDATTGTGALTIRAVGTQSGPNVNYTSARIRTTNLFSQTYGLFEIRARFPAGNGLWPALWMMPKDSAYGGWPTSGEIDIFEGKGQDMGWASSALHSGPAWNQVTVQTRTFEQSGLRPLGFTTAAWHTYSLKWEDGPGTGAGSMTFYIDGVAYHSRVGGWSVPAGQPGSAPFDKPFYFILNMAVGGNFVGGQQPGAGTYDMQVDHVRAYSSIDSIGSPTWASDVNGNWSNYSNWQSAVVPNSVDAEARFAGAITQPRAVTVDTPVTAGRLNFDNPNSYTIAGTQTLTLATSGANAIISVLDGSHTIAAPLSLSRSTNVSVPASSVLTASNLHPAANVVLSKSGPGTLAVNNVRTAGLTVNGGTVQVITAGTNASASRVATISLAGGATPTATLDLSDNDLIVTTTPKAQIEAAIASARNGGPWDGAGGITSSSARDLPGHATTLGVLSGAQYLAVNGTTFAGFTVAASDTLVKYTWYGDTDFNGEVNFDDYVRVDGGFNGGLSGWLNGDMDYSGAVDFDDYVLIDLGFNAQTGTLRRAQSYLSGEDRSLDDFSPGLAVVQQHFKQFGLSYAQHFLAAVPEPGSLSCAAGSVLAALTIRRRRCVRTR